MDWFRFERTKRLTVAAALASRAAAPGRVYRWSIVAVCVLSYNLYKAKQEPEGLQINVGPGGLKIQSK